MTQTASHSAAYYEKVIEAQKRIINTQRAELAWFTNSALPIAARYAGYATEKFTQDHKPGEDGRYKAYLPDMADESGVSASTISRGIQTLAAATEALDKYTLDEWDEDGNKHSTLYIQPTDLFSRPSEIRPTKDLPQHGGKRVKICTCGSENIVEKKLWVCADCGTVYKDFKPRPVNTPLQDEMGESESSEEQAIDPEALQVAILTSVDTGISSCNGLLAHQELQALAQWVVVRDKKPYDAKLTEARAKYACDYTDPACWATYDQCLAKLQESQSWTLPYTHVGFCFKKGGGLVGIDRDNSLAPLIDSYGETSTRGAGNHQFAHGELPRNIKRSDLGIELYDHDRFFVWTGNHLAGTPLQIQDRQEQINALFAEIAPPVREDIPRPQFTCSRSDEEILDKARNAKNGAKFRALYDDGNTAGYASQSEADQALCELLLYWADADVSTVERLFEHSGLNREKWERADYRERTINRALGLSRRKWVAA